MLIDVSWAGSRTCAAPVLRLGQPLLADNVRRPQHPDTGCWHWRHVHEIPLCLLSSACRQIPGGGKGSKSDGDWDTLMLELAELKEAVFFSSLAQNVLNLDPQRVKYGRENSLSSTQLCNDRNVIFEWPGIVWSKVVWPVVGPEITSSSSFCICSPSWCVKRGKDCSDHKSLRNGTGADRVGGKSVSLMSLEGLLGVLASLPGKLPHLEEENLPWKQPAICKALYFILF